MTGQPVPFTTSIAVAGTELLFRRFLPTADAPFLPPAPLTSAPAPTTAFTYVLSAKVVDRGMNSNGFIVSKARYQQIFEYVIAQENLPDGAQWGTLSAEQWKALLTQASTETVAMLNYDIGATPNAAQQKLKYGRIPVSLDQAKGDRSWIRTNFGLMLSVSSASLTAKSSS